MISMDKTYKRADGAEATVKFTDGPSACPVGVITNGILLAYGHNMLPAGIDVQLAIYHAMRLIEVSPYADFVIDEKVMARDFGSDRWTRCNFAAVGPDQKPRAWDFGGTKWTAVGATVWDECRRPTAEELAA